MNRYETLPYPVFVTVVGCGVNSGGHRGVWRTLLLPLKSNATGGCGGPPQGHMRHSQPPCKGLAGCGVVK